jgi:hypothetical protein
MPEPDQMPTSFAQLKVQLGHAIDRGGDSQLDDTLKGQLLNAAEQHICAELGGYAYFLEATGEIVLPIGQSPTAEENGVLVLSSQVANVISFRDEANRRQLEKVDRERWNAFITDPTATTGPPLAWCQFGYIRRTNAESPGMPYGQIKIRFWPVPSADHTLNYDYILKPGAMQYDDDYPVIPISFHFVLLEVASWFAGAYDIGNAAMQKHMQLAQVLMATLRRDAIRMKSMPGNVGFIPGEVHARNAGPAFPTRANQLSGAWRW